MSVAMSVVIPAYNEALRLPAYLEAIRPYLTEAFQEDYEVIVVDDGSHDGTDEVSRRWCASWDRLRVLTHQANRGKGAAVRTGMLAASGRLLLFADADGATPIEEEARLRRAIEQDGVDLAIGSRRTQRCCRAWHRGLCSRMFSLAARRLLSISARDTQCGFKMFRREAAAGLFSQCPEDGYLFDLYILAMAERRGYRVAEVGIRWSDVAGSKVRLVRDSWRMLAGLLRLRRAVLGLGPARSRGMKVAPRVQAMGESRDPAGSRLPAAGGLDSWGLLP